MMAVFGNVMPTDMYTDTNASGKSTASIFRIVFMDIPETPGGGGGQDPLQR
jgi:hypothetical protein